jgi:hypothetical protein
MESGSVAQNVDNFRSIVALKTKWSIAAEPREEFARAQELREENQLTQRSRRCRIIPLHRFFSI